MEFWNNIYSNFNPIAFSVFSLNVHWYGMMYVLALLSALGVAKWLIKKDNLPITQSQLDDYFIYIEIGIILGARLGYIIFYSPDTIEYLTHPWQIFNPFENGEFVGIRGMSYHGAVIGFFLGGWYYVRKHKVSFGILLDLAAIAVPAGFIFGRIGNFLNQELVGRATDVPWGIYVDGILRHPSQLYESFLEGVVVFLVTYSLRHYKHFNGELILVYGFMYGLGRFIAEFFRQPDVQLGFIYGGWMSMGQLLSSFMIITAIILWSYIMKTKGLNLSSRA